MAGIDSIAIGRTTTAVSVDRDIIQAILAGKVACSNLERALAEEIHRLTGTRRWKRGVDVSSMTPKAIEKFWSLVDKSGGEDACWPWLGRCNKDGYGHTYIKGNRSDVRVHRVACALAGIPQPEGMEADHLCRNRPCCNPKHIQFVTPEENKNRSTAPHKLNALKTECHKGHPLSGPNLAIIRAGGGKATRCCLTCYPRMWMYAVEERAGPAKSTVKWRGPYRVDA